MVNVVNVGIIKNIRVKILKFGTALGQNPKPVAMPNLLSYDLKMHLKFRPKASARLIKPRAVRDSLVACDTAAVAAF